MTTALPFLLSIARRAGEVTADGTADSGSTSTLVDAALLFSRAEQLQGKEITIHTGAAAGDSRVIITFTPASDTVAPDANFSSAIDSTSQYFILNTYTLAKLRGVISNAIRELAILKHITDDTTVLTPGAVDYAVPSSFQSVTTVSPETNIITLNDCESTFTYASYGTGHETGAGTALTQAVSTTQYRVGAASVGVLLPTSAVTANVSLIKDLGGTIDLSGRSVIRGWIYVPSSMTIATTYPRLRFYDTATPVAAAYTESISATGTIVADTWTQLSWTLANPIRDNKVMSMALYCNSISTTGVLTAYFDGFRAGGDFNSDLDTSLWRLQGSNIQFVNGYIADNDLRLRITGQQLLTLPTDNTTAVDPLIEAHSEYFANYLAYDKLMNTDWTSRPERANKASILKSQLDGYKSQFKVSRLDTDGRKL